MNRLALIHRCRELEQRARRCGIPTTADMAQRFGNELLYRAMPVELYTNWIDQIEGFVVRREDVMRREKVA